MPCNRSSRSSKRVGWLVSHQTLGKMSPSEHGAINAEELLPLAIRRSAYWIRMVGLAKPQLQPHTDSGLATQGSGISATVRRLASTKDRYLTLHDLEIPTERISQLDLPRSFTFDPKKRRTCNDDSDASCTRDRDVQAVEAIQELHSSRRVLRT